MNIIIIGMGEVGKYVAKIITDEGHNVTIVDANEERLSAAEEGLDVRALQGNGASPRILKNAEISKCDLLIAVTSNDESNMLAAQFAKDLGVKKVIARVSNREYLEGPDRGFYHNLLNIDLALSPEILSAIEINKLIRSMGAISVENFADNRVEMIEIPVEEKLRILNKPLKNLKLPKNTKIVAVHRDERVIIPTGGDVILEGDEVFVMGNIEKMHEIQTLFGRSKRKVAKKVMIVGGGQIGYSVAKSIEMEDINVTVIEKDERRCFELAEKLNNSVILNGDGTSLPLLQEEGIENCDVFVTASHEDEVNVMAALISKKYGAKRTIAIVHRPDYQQLYENLDVDITLSPRIYAANQILKYVRGSEIVSVSLLKQDKAEIIELIAAEDSKVVNKPISEIGFPRGAILACVAGQNGTFIPNGTDKIEPGSTVIVVTSPDVRHSVERFFKRRIFSLS